MKVLLDNGHGENTPGKRSPKWSDWRKRPGKTYHGTCQKSTGITFRYSS